MSINKNLTTLTISVLLLLASQSASGQDAAKKNISERQKHQVHVPDNGGG